jgi:hypothetical protein
MFCLVVFRPPGQKTFEQLATGQFPWAYDWPEDPGFPLISAPSIPPRMGPIEILLENPAESPIGRE